MTPNAHTTDVAIIDSGVGNLGSIKNMLHRAGVSSTISADPGVLAGAKKLILPGVGAFDSGMEMLRSRGLVDLIVRTAHQGRVPLLGICLGAQLLFERSEEGRLPGLGLIAGEVVRFQRERLSTDLRIPHMGWNDVVRKKQSMLFDGMVEVPRFYFVHSYHFMVREEADVLCTSEHGYPFVAGVERANLFAVQFHPEKSHKFGLKLLENFARL